MIFSKVSGPSDKQKNQTHCRFLKSLKQMIAIGSIFFGDERERETSKSTYPQPFRPFSRFIFFAKSPQKKDAHFFSVTDFLPGVVVPKMLFEVA